MSCGPIPPEGQTARTRPSAPSTLVGRRVARKRPRHPPFGDVDHRALARPDGVAATHEALGVRSQQRLDLEPGEIDQEEALALERAHEGPTPVGCRGDVMDGDRQDGARHRPVGPDPREERARSPPTVGHAVGELGMVGDGPAAQPGEVRPETRNQHNRLLRPHGRHAARRGENARRGAEDESPPADAGRGGRFSRRPCPRAGRRSRRAHASISN